MAKTPVYRYRTMPAKISHLASHPHNTLACNHIYIYLHSHLLPAHTPAPHSHLYFGYKLPVRHVPSGLVSTAAKDRANLPANTHPPHALAKYTKEPWL